MARELDTRKAAEELAKYAKEIMGLESAEALVCLFRAASLVILSDFPNPRVTGPIMWAEAAVCAMGDLAK